jgi:toxin FitB
VLSEATKPAPDAKAVEWLRRNEREIAVDPIILGEIRFGIHLLPAGRRRHRLEHWFNEGVTKAVCLPWEATTGLRWAKLPTYLPPLLNALEAILSCRRDPSLAQRPDLDYDTSWSPLVAS